MLGVTCSSGLILGQVEVPIPRNSSLMIQDDGSRYRKRRALLLVNRSSTDSRGTILEEDNAAP